jgi:hypothetical protein
VYGHPGFAHRLTSSYIVPHSANKRWFAHSLQ